MTRLTLVTIAGSAMLLLAGCIETDAGDAAAPIASDVKTDETIVFFPTAGWLDEASGEWHLPIHGWIYEPEDSSVRIGVAEKILEEKYGLAVSEQAAANFSRRVNLLLADNERGKAITVTIAGSSHALPESTANGHFQETLVLPVEQVTTHAKNDLLHYSATTGGDEARDFKGTVRLLDPDGLSVISDIDDTVKISNVTNRRSLLEHTFLLDFVAVPGMAGLYQRWSADDVWLHFVSSSPWHLYEPLREFLAAASFPRATFSLKSIRFRDETLFDLFKEGTETKPAAIRDILDRYPARHFILVGDSGEQDPEVYAALLRERPEQILRVYIRNVTGARKEDERFTRVFDNVDPERWQLFEDPASLATSLPTPTGFD